MSKKQQGIRNLTGGGVLVYELKDMIRFYLDKGYSNKFAEARVCQDIIIKAIEKSNFSENITIKGGVVMANLTGNLRRATEDIDLDFIKYSLNNNSIQSFIKKLNCIDCINIQIKDDKIETLSQQEYQGKRVYISINDEKGTIIACKMDLGVHVNTCIEQDEYYFDVCLSDESVSLLINSCEQILVEKLKSLLRFGPLSTRYKDIFDIYYLVDYVDKEKLLVCMNTYIFNDQFVRENTMQDILKRLNLTFSNRQFKKNISLLNDKIWLQIKIDEAFNKILMFLDTLI